MVADRDRRPLPFKGDYMKDVERIHKQLKYVLYNPHNRKYIQSVKDCLFTKNMLKAEGFSYMHEDVPNSSELEGFEWRALEMILLQTKTDVDPL